MEIHIPHEPILSRKQFFVHLSMIVIGVLIALSFENLVEMWHHRHLAHQARENLHAEILANRAKLKKFTDRAINLNDGQRRAASAVADWIAQHESPINSFELDFDYAQLNESAWQTAQSTGALGFLDYAEVQRYSAIYDAQRRFMADQSQLLSSINSIRAVPEPDPKRNSPVQLGALQSRVSEIKASILATDFSTAYLAALYEDISNQ